MWKTLGKTIDLEEAVPLNENVYLGCQQTVYMPASEEVERKSDPVWSLEEDEDRVPAACLRFPMELQFRPTVAKKK